MTTTTAPRKLELGRIGESIVRADGVPKVKGEFAFSSDLSAPGMLWGHTVRSPHAHARITAIDISEAVTMPGVHAVLTHADVPGEKSYGLEFRDQPVLAIDRVRYFGEAVVLVAAEHPEQARRAADKVRVDYEPLPLVADMERAFDGPELHPDRPTAGHGFREDSRANVVRNIVITTASGHCWRRRRHRCLRTGMQDQAFPRAGQASPCLMAKAGSLSTS